MWSPSMLINWFWISGDVYVAFLAALWRWSLKIVSPAEYESWEKHKICHGLCLLLVHLPYLCHYHDDHGEQCSADTRQYLCNRAELLSVVLDGFSCSFFQLNWHTLSLTTHPLYESITDSNGIFVVLSSSMEITSNIFLKLVNAVSTSTPLPFRSLCS